MAGLDPPGEFLRCQVALTGREQLLEDGPARGGGPLPSPAELLE